MISPPSQGQALIFVCQQWHAISSRGTGAKTQVLILSTLMALMVWRMRETACHWKCNALYGTTSWTDGRNMNVYLFLLWIVLISLCKQKVNTLTRINFMREPLNVNVQLSLLVVCWTMHTKTWFWSRYPPFIHHWKSLSFCVFFFHATSSVF